MLEVLTYSDANQFSRNDNALSLYKVVISFSNALCWNSSISRFKNKIFPFHHQQIRDYTRQTKTISPLEMVTTVCFVFELLLMITVSLSLWVPCQCSASLYTTHPSLQPIAGQHQVDSTASRESTPLPVEPFPGKALCSAFAFSLEAQRCWETTCPRSALWKMIWQLLTKSPKAPGNKYQAPRS